MNQAFKGTFTFYLIAGIVVLVLAIFARCADAQEEVRPPEAPLAAVAIKPVKTDWGQYELGTAAVVINVRQPFTVEKRGLGELATGEPFKKFSSQATENTKKLLTKIWDIEGVSNIRFSTYTMVIFKATMFEWDEIKPVILDAFSAWHNADKK